MDENILFSYELKDAWFLPIAGVEVYKTGEVRCMTGDARDYVESTKVLELNPNHTVFAALKAAHAAGDTDKVAKYAELLYDQALLIAGLPIEDPVAYAQLVCGLMQ